MGKESPDLRKTLAEADQFKTKLSPRFLTALLTAGPERKVLLPPLCA